MGLPYQELRRPKQPGYLRWLGCRTCPRPFPDDALLREVCRLLRYDLAFSLLAFSSGLRSEGKSVDNGACPRFWTVGTARTGRKMSNVIVRLWHSLLNKGECFDDRQRCPCSDKATRL